MKNELFLLLNGDIIDFKNFTGTTYFRTVIMLCIANPFTEFCVAPSYWKFASFIKTVWLPVNVYFESHRPSDLCYLIR